MGRLTLNVLLSFAQFEREVISERVRDKIAASKAKGMWMGGSVPVGYDAVDRKLVPNETEAETVRFIMRQYLKLGNVRLLQSDSRPLLMTWGVVRPTVIVPHLASGWGDARLRAVFLHLKRQNSADNVRR